MTKAVIRPAPIALKEELCAVCRQTWQDHAERQPYAFPADGWERVGRVAFDHAFLAANGERVEMSNNLFIAERDEQLVGYLLLSWWARRDAPQMPSVSINDVWVQANLRGTGVGRMLVGYAKQLSQARGWDNLTAQIWAGNPSSRSMFIEAGFCLQSETLRFGPDGSARAYPPAKKRSFVRDRIFGGDLSLRAGMEFLLAAAVLTLFADILFDFF